MRTTEAATVNLPDRITQNVRNLMHSRGYHLDMDLATAAGWSKSDMSRRFKGKWQLADLPRLAAALRVDPAFFLSEPGSYLPKEVGIVATESTEAPNGRYLPGTVPSTLRRGSLSSMKTTQRGPRFPHARLGHHTSE